VFSNSAAFEARRKALLGAQNFDQNLGVYDSLIRHTLKEAEQTGLPFFFVDERLQVGESFGARIAHAVDSVFAQNFERVILIGNDSPNLGRKQLSLAVDVLSKGKSVIGPAEDGGAYLLGLQKDSFDAVAFAALPWQSAHLQKYLQAFFKACNTPVVYLNLLGDIDEKRQLLRFIYSGLHTEVRKQLAYVLSGRQQEKQFTAIYLPKSPVLKSLGLRGPPVVHYI
jgi:glycosyltransferase A (GT-A) superfamily protein (DUF2064 family)